MVPQCVCEQKSLVLLLLPLLLPNNLNIPQNRQRSRPKPSTEIDITPTHPISSKNHALGNRCALKSPLSSLDLEGRQSGSAQREFPNQSLLLDDDIQSDQIRAGKACALLSTLCCRNYNSTSFTFPPSTLSCGSGVVVTVSHLLIFPQFSSLGQNIFYLVCP